jgi:hypothetical protein
LRERSVFFSASLLDGEDDIIVSGPQAFTARPQGKISE